MYSVNTSCSERYENSIMGYAMTVRELREKLATMPDNVEVIYSYHSEYAILTDTDIRLVPAQSKEICERRGQHIRYRDGVWPSTEKPKFVTVVVLPGN